MADSREQRAREMQLEAWLQALLGEADGDEQGDSGAAASPEVAALRDMAQRFRAAAQRIPLPEGRRALRRALATSAKGDPGEPAMKRARPHRPWWAVAGAAAVLLLGVAIAGVGPRWGRMSASSPWYGLRVAFEEAKVALTPSPVGEAQMLVKATQERIDEIREMAIAGDMNGLHRAAAALDSEAGWLHAIMVTLPPAERKHVEQVLETI